jgi:hypothetical protein
MRQVAMLRIDVNEWVATVKHQRDQIAYLVTETMLEVRSFTPAPVSSL